METMFLMGSEDVSRAGSQMSSAASTMSSATSSIADTMENHRRFMEEWLAEFRVVLEEYKDIGAEEAPF